MLTSLALFPQLQELPTKCIYAFLLLSPQMLNGKNIYMTIFEVLLLIEVHVINTSKLLYTILMGSDKS